MELLATTVACKNSPSPPSSLIRSSMPCSKPCYPIFNARFGVISWSCRHGFGTPPAWLRLKGSNPIHVHMIPPHPQLIANLVWWDEIRTAFSAFGVRMLTSQTFVPLLVAASFIPDLHPIPSLRHYRSL